MARRAFLASTLAALAAPAVLRSAQANAPALTFKLHHAFSAVSSVHDKFLVPWARKIEADSGGRIRIDLFPSMELGGAPAQLFDQARDGTAEIIWTAPGLTPGRFPKIETFELPFLPSRRALVSSHALQDFAAVYLRDEFDEIHPLGFSCADRSVIHAYAAVRSLDDMKGLNLHVQTRLAGEAARVLGAHPVPMPGEELPAALAARVIDGCVDPWHMVPTFRLSDVLKTHTEFADWSLSSRTYVLAMNKPAYERLPRELKSVVDANSGQLAAGMAGAMWDIQARVVAENVAQSGDDIVTLLPEAVAHWRKATEPVVSAWLKDMKDRKADGDKMIASAHALLSRYADLPEPQPPQPPRPPPSEQGPAAPPPRPAGATATQNGNASVAPPAKPVPPAPAPPHVATQTPVGASSTKSAVIPAPTGPTVKPPPVAPHPVTQGPPPAPPAPAVKPGPAASPAPVAKSVPPAPAPAPMPAPAPAPPKTLNIPL